MINKIIAEKTIELAVCKYARSKGWSPFKLVMRSGRGVPDRAFMQGGHVFFIEFKRKGGKMSAVQNARAQEINKLGFDVYLVDDIAGGKALIDKETVNLAGE